MFPSFTFHVVWKTYDFPVSTACRAPLFSKLEKQNKLFLSTQYSCWAVCCIKLWAMYAMEGALVDASRGDLWLGYKNSHATTVCKQLCFSSGSVEPLGVSPNLKANSEEKYNNVVISYFALSFVVCSPLPRWWQSWGRGQCTYDKENVQLQLCTCR